MCTEGRRIWSRSLCLREPNQIAISCITLIHHVLYPHYVLSYTMSCTFQRVLSHCNFEQFNLLIKQFNFPFTITKDLPSVSQSNEPAVTAENEKQYIFSNITYIKFQYCLFFSLRSILKEVLLK